MSYDASTGGKGFQTRQAPSQAVAYAPMNIPRMSFAQPSFYYPSIANQMAGLGGLGGLGATQPLIPRPPMQMASYPALQPPTQPTTPSAPPIATGGKGFQPNMPGRGYRPNTPYNPGITAVAPPRNPVDNVFGPYTGSMREQVEDPGIDYPQEYSIDRVRRPEGYPQEQAAGMSESDSDFAARMAAMRCVGSLGSAGVHVARARGFTDA
jgi:hypothetical protein